MPLIETKGAASAQGFGGVGAGASETVNYIEDVFSTYLYTGNSSTQTITNGIDLAGKGGLVWRKARTGTYSTDSHGLTDTVRGATSVLQSNATDAAFSSSAWGLSSFNNDGFTIPSTGYPFNWSGTTYVSWTFREQPKFFDIVTYTGNGTGTNIGSGVLQRDITHNLTSTPGCVIIKNLDTSNWVVYHRSSTSGTKNLRLNTTDAGFNASGYAPIYAVSSTTFSVIVGATGLSSSDNCNLNGATYVAYLFAHNAGGFGLSGTDNVISCGSYTGSNGAGQAINLGYEAQWVLIKNTSRAGQNWVLMDNMRQFDNTGYGWLYPNTSGAEATGSGAYVVPTATGFATTTNVNAATDYLTDSYIYIAIRRGPMKVPTSGTSVFGLNARTGTGANATVTGSAGVSDAVLIKNRGSAVGDLFASRLTGTGYLETSSTAAEVAAGTTILQANPWDVMDGVKVGTTSTITNASANTYINYLFDRAPSFFDEVCVTGDGTTSKAVPHNLGVVPEIVITKTRNAVGEWYTYVNALWSDSDKKGLNLRTNGAASTTTVDGSGTFPTRATASNFYIGGNSNINGETKVLYLFATCAGVSKVGSYTGTGALQTINCGFTGGARFVLIKRTDSTGDWYVYDSARGISSGNDPYLLLNSTAAEVTGTNYVDTTSVGFQVTAAAPAGLNANGGSFVFLAIA